MMSLKNSWVLKETGIVSALQSLPEPFVILVGCAGNKVTDFSQLQSSGQGGKHTSSFSNAAMAAVAKKSVTLFSA